MIAQEFDCATEISQEFYKSFAEEVPAIEAFAEQENDITVVDIPVRFTIYHQDDGTGNEDVDDAYIDEAIDILNQNFGTLTGFNFITCGEINHVNNSILYNQFNVNDFIDYDHISNAVNVHVRGSNGVSRAKLPCAYRAEQGLDCEIEESLGISLRLQSDLHNTTFTHEMGHHFGLLHTFSPQSFYNIPVEDDQTDHPYGDLSNGTPRELVIRAYDDLKEYPTVNCLQAGDLVCDTPPACRVGSSFAQMYPDPTDPLCFDDDYGPSSPCSSGCIVDYDDCTHIGNYQDYNGDPISPPVIGNFVINFMSYTSSCHSEFTQGQGQRILYYYVNDRFNSYNSSLCDNHNDDVEFEDTNEGLDRVVLRFNHLNGEERFCNTLTNPEGEFHGVLYDDKLTAEVIKFGSGATLEEYTYNDWVNGVTTWDMVLLTKHVLNIDKLESGYSQLAADANNSGTVTTFDRVLFTKLILGIDQELEHYTQPWVFLPEYVPQDNTAAFHNDPFNMTLDGDTYTNDAPYIDTDWEFEIPDGNNGKAGFDAVKLGDLNGSANPNLLNPECPDDVFTDILIPNDWIAEGDIIEIDFKSLSFQDIVAFQAGLYISNEHFEVLDLLSGDLSDFSKEENSGLTNLENNELRVAWFNSLAQKNTMADGSSLFKLELEAKQDIADLSEVLYLNDDILKTLFFTETGCIADTDIEAEVNILDDRSAGKSGNRKEIEISKQLTCYPNPFQNQLQIVFDLEQASESAEILIQDAFGKMISGYTSDFREGRNIFSVRDLSDMPEGVLLITIKTEQEKLSGKAIKLN